uniref:SHOCT domain-containing protein n=1 Tax=Coccolithus braarudii TaxID=221442 RepID=A0A7S0LGY0_9EUKA|mmetsp:Transcript_39852/g.85001  ORF Transcript_39852/g.85001 Transcript_39852/m.85001 type:complete len:238 (+) Transcript_39852:81-794(+)
MEAAAPADSANKLPGNGTADDIARAKAVVAPNETILAVWRCPKEEAFNAMCGTTPILICFWCPVVWCSALPAKAIYESTIYVLTEQNLYRDIGDFSCSCVRVPPVRAQIALGEINMTTISVKENYGTECFGACFPVSALYFNTPSGHAFANFGASKHRPANQTMIVMGGDKGFAEAICDLIKDKVQSAGVASPVPVSIEMARDDPTETIAKLKSLLDSGAITQDEFDQQKAEQLSRL